MIVTCLDCETTGLNPESDRILELGVVLYDTRSKRILRSQCFLLNDESEPFKVSLDISKINFITQEMLNNFTLRIDVVFDAIFGCFIKESNYIVAHNAPFDKGFIDAETRRQKKEKWSIPWIDTASDIPYPSNISTRKLTHLAAEHNFLNPFPHTALSDALTVSKLLSLYDFESITKRAESPNLRVCALVDYSTREKAKAKGFRWDDPSKRWIRIIKQCDLEEIKKSFDFEFSVLK